MIALPPGDARLPGLPIALDGHAIRDRLAATLPEAISGRVEVVDAEPTYTRYKPGISCLVGYRLRLLDLITGRTDTLPAQLKVYANDQASRIWSGQSLHRLVERASRMHQGALVTRAALLADLNGLVQVYPVDRTLRQLVRVADRSRAGQVLADVTGVDLPTAPVEHIDLIRYRPARKALLRYRLDPSAASDWGREVYAKIHSDDRAPRIDRMARRLRSAGVPLPEPMGASERHHTAFQAAAHGLPLLELRARPGYEEAMGAVVDTLERLHNVPPADLGDDLPVPVTGHDVWLLHRAGEMLATLLPHEAVPIRRLAVEIATELDSLPRVERHSIHGDFYDDQVLVADGGLTLLDLDEMRLGNPLSDAGNFLGHVSAGIPDGSHGDAAREAFLEAWSSGLDRDRRALLVHEAHALLLMAAGPFRRLEADWPAEIRRHLELAATRLRQFRQNTAATPPRANNDASSDSVSMEVIISGVLGTPVQVTRTQVMRAKPGRRRTVRCELREGAKRRELVAFVKVFASDRAPRVFAALEALAAVSGPGAPRLPHPLGCDPLQRVVLFGEVPGDPCTERLLAGDLGLARAIADALRMLHDSDAGLPRAHRLEDEFAPLAARVERLTATVPELAESAWAALEALNIEARRPWHWRMRPLHRDFYPEQVLVDGEAIGFVDLDDAAMGEPAVDVANFAAHLRLLALQSPHASGALAAVERAFAERSAEGDVELDAALVRLLVGATCLRLAEIHADRTRGPWLARKLVLESLRDFAGPDNREIRFEAEVERDDTLDIDVDERRPLADGTMTMDLPEGAGRATFTVVGARITLDGIAPADGWEVREQERDDESFEVDVVNADRQLKLELSAEIDDGRLELDTETRHGPGYESGDEDADDDADND